MAKHAPSSDRQDLLEQILGYLNFSSGTFDPKLLTNLNSLWESAADPKPVWRQVDGWLRAALSELRSASSAFQDAVQAVAAVDLIFDAVLPRYLEFHKDLLFHQDEDQLFNSFFVGRVCEAVLQQGSPWDESERVVDGAVRKLNDFVGYRPVAVLQSRKVEPYPHEWLRPVPVYVKEVGCAVGPYRVVVEPALELLTSTDPDLLRAASFDPEMLDELALNPQAYDFDHPVNKRPNYHFGQWDPHAIDNQGRYRRFVVQQVTLDAIMKRLDEDGTPSELVFEAAAVLAGTILMASGVSGGGPDAHDSTTSLSTLLPRIAEYRDAFYDRLLSCAAPDHQQRLDAEAVERRQPFGAARQHLNSRLARRRASQLEHVQLAKLFARMGYAGAATEQAHVVPAASARMLGEIDCRLTVVRQALDERDAARAAELLPEITSLLRRGIRCGAIVDPWNILGFDAQFSLFPALENSVHDHRVDELVELLAEMFNSFARAWAEAAARDQTELCERLSTQFHELATWWRQFAAHEVSNAGAVDPMDAYRAAEHVAKVLNLWHKGGAASGDIKFWAPHAELFQSPQAYALVIEALFEQRDYVACRALLVHWLGEAERVPLEQGEDSFHRLAERWLTEVMQNPPSTEEPADLPDGSGISTEQWQLICKFFDYTEANAEQFWQVPMFEFGNGQLPSAGDSDSFETVDQEDEQDLYGAAYEDMVYRDSTDDGVDSEIFEGGAAEEDGLAHEAEYLANRLAFHITLARLWRICALTPIRAAPVDSAAATERSAALDQWAKQANVNRRGLLNLLEAVNDYRIPLPLGDHESMLDYDRRRVVKESLLEQIITTVVETIDAQRLMEASRVADDGSKSEEAIEIDEDRLIVPTLAAAMRADVQSLENCIDDLIAALEEHQLLYVPLAKGGVPSEIAMVRARQRYIQFLLKCLPRLGCFVATCRLIETARDMERNNPVGAGAVTEFDELFKTGFKSLVHALVDSSETWETIEDSGDGPELLSSPLVTRLEQLTEALLVSWLAHSRTLRLSVMEKATDKRSWKTLVDFVERFGGDLFSQRFLNIGNIRAILHQGCDVWLERLEAERHDIELALLDEIDKSIPRAEAVEQLTLVLETIVENYGEYRDYNSTTTQSDRGELLYTLLDFLRLRARYDRVCWNLKPVVIAHEILVRRGCKRAAQIWRRALRERIGEEADKFHEKLINLQRKYSMQMPSIADRLGERFVRPMVIDRICSLVEPAMGEARRPCPRPTFRILQYEIEFLTREPSGVGFDVPAWLLALDEEIQRVDTPPHEREDYDELALAVPSVVLSLDEIEDQLDQWADD
jgi:hypothetical protein